MLVSHKRAIQSDACLHLNWFPREAVLVDDREVLTGKSMGG